MNISGIRPTLGLYTNKSESFGAYDVSKLHKSGSDELKINKMTSVHSNSQVEKALDVMKKDTSLHKYQKFVKEPLPARQPGRDVLENFTL